jgi:uncharacterized membrane protein YkoI
LRRIKTAGVPHPENALTMRRALLFLLPLALAGVVAQADPRDHDRARAALQAGEVLPLATVLQRVAQSHPGDVLEVELERDHGRWVYELRLLQPGGALLKLEVDARTGEVLQARERRR